MAKGLKTTVQESKGKYTTPIPTSLINLLGIEKGNKFNWTITDEGLNVKVVKA